MFDDDQKKTQGEVIIYQSQDGDTKIDVRFVDKTVWLTQAQLVELFQSSKANISEHINNIYIEGELDRESTVRKFRTVRKEGNRKVSRELVHYNLDMILSLGYRVKSKIATHFRRWATSILKEYLLKGFAMDDERLKNLGEGNYWDELKIRIRDIRSSEKVFYRQVLDIYATSIDYDPKSEISLFFFKTVQNKIHYAVHGNTAAEVIYRRVDSEKEFLGVTHFKGNQPTLQEIKIAKNYLDEKELKALGQLVEGYLAFAERQADRHIPMTMADWTKHLDMILTSTGEELLKHAGKISHHQAMERATQEYKKYQQKTLSNVEREYLDTIGQLEELSKKGGTK